MSMNSPDLGGGNSDDDMQPPPVTPESESDDHEENQEIPSGSPSSKSKNLGKWKADDMINGKSIQEFKKLGNRPAVDYYPKEEQQDNESSDDSDRDNVDVTYRDEDINEESYSEEEPESESSSSEMEFDDEESGEEQSISNNAPQAELSSDDDVTTSQKKYCFICGKVVRFWPSERSCSCNYVFHVRCTETRPECPICNQPFPPPLL